MAGGMHGRGHAWQGGHACQGGAMHARGLFMAGGMHGRGVCRTGGVHGTHTPPSRYYEIQSMSGRYASYWNAFLFPLQLRPECLDWNRSGQHCIIRVFIGFIQRNVL